MSTPNLNPENTAYWHRYAVHSDEVISRLTEAARAAMDELRSLDGELSNYLQPRGNGHWNSENARLAQGDGWISPSAFDVYAKLKEAITFSVVTRPTPEPPLAPAEEMLPGFPDHTPRKQETPDWDDARQELETDRWCQEYREQFSQETPF